MLPGSNIPICVIADDVRASRTVLEKWVGRCGYACELTENGEDAWDAILRLTPDLVVTDIEMPGASGLDLLYSIRRHSLKKIRTLPVIVISSLIDGKVREFVNELGGTLFLPKPLNKETTQRVVSNITTVVSEVPVDNQNGISPTLRQLYRDIKINGPKFMSHDSQDFFNDKEG
jgi:CheY-like chemotaxis protein